MDGRGRAWLVEEREYAAQWQRRVLARRAPEGLDLVFAPLWKVVPDHAARLRVIVDQVASLTDPAAVAWHRRLVAPGLHVPDEIN